MPACLADAREPWGLSAPGARPHVPEHPQSPWRASSPPRSVERTQSPGEEGDTRGSRGPSIEVAVAT